MNIDVANLLATLPPVIERHELKYVIPYALIDPICAFINPYCVYDAHSAESDDRYYCVHSLYFDTPNYRFLKQRMWGSERRFNMRVRAYGDGTQGPYYAEVKYKTPTSVRKFRASIETAEWPSILPSNKQFCEPEQPRVRSTGDAANLQLFRRLATAYNIEPKIFTSYRRRAFFSTLDDYARVTFDINMRYRPQDPLISASPFSLSPDRGCVNYDLQTIYEEELHHKANVILELKTTIGAVPLWMVELIRRFELKQVGFSKYLNSSLVQHVENDDSYMSTDRLAAPVRV